ncbi:MAG: hypothetical protein AAB275_07110, partial [Deltaproteobacteria bacterium]
MKIYKILVLVPLLLSACAGPTVKVSLVKSEVVTEPEERIAPGKAYFHYTQSQLKLQESDIAGAIDETKKALGYDPESPFLHT